MLALILTLGYAAVAIKVAAAYRIHRKLRGSFPAVTASLLFTSLRIVCALNFSFEVRQMLYAVGSPIDLALEGLAILEVFRVVTAKHFPTRALGGPVLATFAFIAAAVSFVTRYVWAAPSAEWLRATVLLERYAVVWQMAFVAMAWLFLRLTRRISVAPVAAAGVVVFAVNAACGLGIVVALALTGMRSWWAVSVAPVASAVITGLLWLLTFAGASPDHAPDDDVTRDELAKQQRIELDLVADLGRGRRFLSASE